MAANLRPLGTRANASGRSIAPHENDRPLARATSASGLKLAV